MQVCVCNVAADECMQHDKIMRACVCVQRCVVVVGEAQDSLQSDGGIRDLQMERRESSASVKKKKKPHRSLSCFLHRY